MLSGPNEFGSYFIRKKMASVNEVVGDRQGLRNLGRFARNQGTSNSAFYHCHVCSQCKYEVTFLALMRWGTA